MHRRGLDAIAHNLLEQETIDGATVARLVDEAFGRPVYADGRKVGSTLHAAPPIEPDDEDDAADATGSAVAAGGGWSPPSVPSA